MTEKDEGPPTLPLPSLWRLLVAAIAVVGFLYFIYRYQEARDAAPEGSGGRVVMVSGVY